MVKITRPQQKGTSMKRDNKKNSKRKGITLISLVITVVILLMLTSIVIYVNTNRRKLRNKN